MPRRGVSEHFTRDPSVACFHDRNPPNRTHSTDELDRKLIGHINHVEEDMLPSSQLR